MQAGQPCARGTFCRGPLKWDQATSPSRTTASSETCAAPRWWAWTVPSTGSVCRVSIRRAFLPRFWTTRRVGGFALPRMGTAFAISNSIGPARTSSSHATCMAMAWVEVEDYMPVGRAANSPNQLIRRVRVVRGVSPFIWSVGRASIMPGARMRPGSDRMAPGSRGRTLPRSGRPGAVATRGRWGGRRLSAQRRRTGHVRAALSATDRPGTTLSRTR